MAITNQMLTRITFLCLTGILCACGGGSLSNNTTENQSATVEQSEDTLAETQNQGLGISPAEMTQDELNQLLLDFQTGKESFDFYGVFTEPFWTFYFFDNYVLFIGIDMEGPLLFPLEYPFNPDAKLQTLKFSMFGDLWELQVSKEVGSDGMSEINYPYSVKYKDLVGAGATEPMQE
jgi:uncharacterized membrane protein